MFSVKAWVALIESACSLAASAWVSTSSNLVSATCLLDRDFSRFGPRTVDSRLQKINHGISLGLFDLKVSLCHGHLPLFRGWAVYRICEIVRD